MFEKILIANRGEIACRVIRTARRLGIATVAVHSEADEGALHVEMADEAVAIGPAPSAESYLVAQRIIAAAVESGADAIHPGYGFLSENAEFAEALDAAGIAFIGPKPRAIAVMGDKIESKKLAMEAGVNTIPGHTEAVSDVDAAVKIAAEVGFPVMIKASAGGGGKGMRVARDSDHVRDEFASAVNEARSSFGDDRVFIEKFIEEPRHIEIQVLADEHGNILHLGERECSIQRRHQKVIEEAPSPFVDADLRAEMGAQAITLAKAVDYESVGTVEFIVDRDRNFYFLEMNTRLQVEHPVTELVTGLDLVEQMIRVAAGETLKMTQADLSLDGWAIEARVYAEDPLRNFMPSIGRLVRYRPPAEDSGVRIDTGVFEGGEISIFYDPMIAKLITGGNDRDAAIAAMRAALDAFHIRGIAHNIPFLSAVMAHPRFIEGRLSTGFIEEEYPDGFKAANLVHEEPGLLVAVAAAIEYEDISRARSGFDGPCDLIAFFKEAREYPVRTERNADGWEIVVDGDRYVVAADWRPGDAMFQGQINGNPVSVQCDRLPVGWLLAQGGGQAEIRLHGPHIVALQRRMPVKVPPDTSKFLLSPMPGLLIRMPVAPGDEVKTGEELAVVEAMKMENVLRAERDGVVAKIHAAEGDSLGVDQKILEFA